MIEQKSALYTLDTRNITSDNRIKALDKFLEDNIGKAFIQLNNYNVSSNKVVIRICLTFEQIYFTETIQEIVIPKLNISQNSEHLNWGAINDFEKLFAILSKNQEEFDEIIFKKINYEKEIEALEYKNSKILEENITLKQRLNRYFNKVKNIFIKLLLRGNNHTKDITSKSVKDLYDDKEFNKEDIIDISRGIFKQDELFYYADIPEYYKSNRIKDLQYSEIEEEKEIDQFELEKM